MIIHLAIIILSLLFLVLIIRRIRIFEGYEESSSSDVEAGASQYYDRGIPSSSSSEKKGDKHRCPRCNYIIIDGDNCNNNANPCSARRNRKSSCKDCDIAQHPDIDKYVLKSSVPSCPDMSNYMPKSMMQSMRHRRSNTRIPDDYLSKNRCEDYKQSSYTNINDWMANLFGNGSSNGNGGSDKKTGPKSQSYGWGTGYDVRNPGYGLHGNVVKSSGNEASDGITIQPGQPKSSNSQQQAKDQQDTANYVSGWSQSTLGKDNAVFLGVPNQ